MFLQAGGTQIPLPATDPFRECIPQIAVSEVRLNSTQLSLPVGESRMLNASVLPENATNQNISWSSSDNTITTIDESGKVTAIAEGTATITVTTEDGGKTATCQVTVKKDNENPGGGDEDEEWEDGDYNIEFVYDASGNRIQRKEIILETRAAPTKEPEIFEEIIKQHTVKIYPNPTEGQLAVEISDINEIKSGNLSIYSIQGQMVMKKSINQIKTDLDISQQPSGTYILHININGETSTWKILKK